MRPLYRSLSRMASAASVIVLEFEASILENSRITVLLQTLSPIIEPPIGGMLFPNRADFMDEYPGLALPG